MRGKGRDERETKRCSGERERKCWSRRWSVDWDARREKGSEIWGELEKR